MRGLALVIGLLLGCITSEEAELAARATLLPIGIVDAVACTSGACDKKNATCVAVVRAGERRLKATLKCDDDECDIARIVEMR